MNKSDELFREERNGYKIFSRIKDDIPNGNERGKPIKAEVFNVKSPTDHIVEEDIYSIEEARKIADEQPPA